MCSHNFLVVSCLPMKWGPLWSHTEQHLLHTMHTLCTHTHIAPPHSPHLPQDVYRSRFRLNPAPPALLIQQAGWVRPGPHVVWITRPESSQAGGSVRLWPSFLSPRQQPTASTKPPVSITCGSGAGDRVVYSDGNGMVLWSFFFFN